MKKYYFYDYNYEADMEQTLSRETYKELLEFCFSRSEVIAFQICNQDVAFADWLEQFRVPRPENLDVRVFRLVAQTPEEAGYRFYNACPELQQWMLDAVGNIFEWVAHWEFNNPENPAFFRADGSAVLYSLIHEFEIILQVEDDENVEHILSKEKWLTKAMIGYDKVDAAMVKRLLENGADISQFDALSSPIHYVAEMSPIARNENGEFVYNEDVAQDIVEIAKLVIRDSDINDYSRRFTPLMRAAMLGNKALVEYFLSIGADKNAKLSDGNTAYDLAMLNGHTEVAELLK